MRNASRDEKALSRSRGGNAVGRLDPELAIEDDDEFVGVLMHVEVPLARLRTHEIDDGIPNTRDLVPFAGRQCPAELHEPVRLRTTNRPQQRRLP